MSCPKSLVCFSELTARPIDWLWPRWLPSGKLVLLDGDPDQGKSLLTLDWAARLTTGRPWPDGAPLNRPESVVLLAGEDNLLDTVSPRLLAAGADLSRVHVLRVGPDAAGQLRAPQFPAEAALVRETIEETQARLVIADPLLAYLPAGLNGPQVRQALTPLADIAQETGATLVMVRHLTKNDRHHTALHRGAGSIQVVACARVGLLVGRHPEEPDLRLLACFKNNLTEKPPTLSYRIRDHASRPVIDWAGSVPLSADDLALGNGERYGSSVARAIEFLREMLTSQALPRQQVALHAQDVGVSRATLKRACLKLRVVAYQIWEENHNVWYWRLPTAPTIEEEYTQFLESIRQPVPT
ncbi:MAG: AAA family ATPase [Gemmataceae bacterium]